MQSHMLLFGSAMVKEPDVLGRDRRTGVRYPRRVHRRRATTPLPAFHSVYRRQLARLIVNWVQRPLPPPV